MSFDTLLKNARLSSGLTQAQLAERSGLLVPNISAIESGRRTPRFDTAELLLRTAGYRLLPVEIGRSTAWEVAAFIHEELAMGSLAGAFRTWLQLNNDLLAVGPSGRFLLSLQPPARTGSSQWDAAIAALVEHRLRELALPVPEWVNEPWRSLPEEQTLLTSDRFNMPIDAKDAPEAFLKHKILFPLESLVSY